VSGRVVSCAVSALALCLLVSPAAQGFAAPDPVEPYASYRPQTRCAKAVKPGTDVLGHWLVSDIGGAFGPTWRACTGDSVSEHKDGRAFDWLLDARRKHDRRLARNFLTAAFATDDDGNEHALARRMGIMYLIWNDRMYAAYDRFEVRPYLSSSCKTRRKCSRTLRHRDHMHLSLSRAGARGDTSWYAGRLPD
jgi:hypothetical protein